MFALVLAIGCGEEDPPAPNESSDDDSSEQDDSTGKADDDGKGGKDDSKSDDDKGDDKGDDEGPKKPLDASVKPPKPPQDPTPAADASTSPPTPTADAGASSKPDASTGTSKDGGSSTGPTPTGVCDKTTPHGCFKPVAKGNHPMCPPQSPEQSMSYPPMPEWKGCNNIMPAAPVTLDPDAHCAYEGPNKELANCICDTGLHWICSCSKSGQAGIFGFGSWPDCT